MLFLDSTENNNAHTIAWHWNFGTGSPGDTSSLPAPSFTYNESGEYEVSLVTVNNWGCFDTVKKPAFVYVSPTADFDFTIGCIDDKVEFTDLSFAEEDDEVTAWQWNFGDGSTNEDVSDEQHPVYRYDYLGEKEIELIVFNTIGCADTLKQIVDIHPSPSAGFSVLQNYDNEQGNVSLIDASTDAESYYWDFGDGYSIYDDYPPVNHSYEYDGLYEIEQVVWNEFGCPDTALVEYDFMFKTLFIPNALNPNGVSPETKVFKPKGRNLQYFHIAIYNTWGEILWESDKLDADGSPIESWDGTYEGKLVPIDVYIWKAEAVFRDGTFWEGTVVGNNDGSSQATSGYVVVVR
jgi:PKD repeat protein